MTERGTEDNKKESKDGKSDEQKKENDKKVEKNLTDKEEMLAGELQRIHRKIAH